MHGSNTVAHNLLTFKIGSRNMTESFIQEIYELVKIKRVLLADLLLLFIYTEVLGMVAVFYKSNRIPVTLPLFIAMTALARMIILQGKDPSDLLYEAGAIVLVALACLIIRIRPPENYRANIEE